MRSSLSEVRLGEDKVFSLERVHCEHKWNKITVYIFWSSEDMMDQRYTFGSHQHHTRTGCRHRENVWRKKMAKTGPECVREKQKIRRLQRWCRWSRVREVVGKPIELFDSYTIEIPGSGTRLYSVYFIHYICNILCFGIHMTFTFIVTCFIYCFLCTICCLW